MAQGYSFTTTAQPGVGLAVRVAAWDLQVLSLSPLAIELTPGGVDLACHPSEVGEMYSLPMKLPRQAHAPLRRERSGIIVSPRMSGDTLV